MQSLADALPDDDATDEPATASSQHANVQRTNLRSRPGVQKRKAKIEQQERERFSQNLAQIMESKASSLKTGSAEEVDSEDRKDTRWLVLREHIAANMVKR
jgi:hypothetical protein